MGVIYVLIAALMWSIVPVLVKSASFMVDSYTITFSRFFFGIILLFLFVWIRQGKVKIGWKDKWIWYGALGKAINYIFENLGISIGYAYEQIVVMPMGMIYMLFVSVLLFKEKLNRYSIVACILSVIGILLVSWDGMPLEQLLETNFVVTGLFALSALGATFHFASQKILIEKMSSEQMNLNVFFWATIITAFPLPFTFETADTGFNMWSMISLIALGTITAVSFYIYGLGVKKVSFITLSILINSSVLFTLLWSYLFYGEPITMYTVSGAIVFLLGMILVNIPAFRAAKNRRMAS